MIQRIDHFVTRLAQGLALLGALGVILMLLHVFLDVASRNLGGPPIPATNAIVSRYYMVLIAFLPLGYVESRNAMIKVELTDMFLTPALRRANDGLVALLSALVYGGISWMKLDTALDNWRVGSFVDVLGRQIPIWPTYFLPTLGFGLAALISLWRAVTDMTGGVRT